MSLNEISLRELEAYLWGAANIIRGRMDAADFKQYVFPLLFFKRISDVYDEEYQSAVRASDGDMDFASFAENHRFQIPPGNLWRDVREQTANVGAALQKAFRAIEKTNPNRLAGIFGDVNWTNKERLPDDLLKDLIEHFSSVDLTLEHVPQDELGVAYEYLVGKFADDSGHTAAEFYTNRTVVHLMTLLLDPQPGESIYDPTCGTGGMLLNAVLRVKQRKHEWRGMQLFGQELNLITSSIAKMNLFLHGLEDFDIRRGDTLSDPKFLEGDRLRRFNVVLANPPYSVNQWNRTAWEADPYGRNLYGVPPQGRADYAFLQHIIASLDPKSGRCAILFPHGVLFRDDEAQMRNKLIEHDIVECIIGLGPNLFYNATMEACVVVCRMQKPKNRRGRILIINAVNEVTRRLAQSFLEELHIKKIVGAYHAFADADGFAHVATLDEIRANDGVLNIPLYVRPRSDGATPGDGKSLKAVLAEWQQSSAELRKSMKELFETLGEAGTKE